MRVLLALLACALCVRDAAAGLTFVGKESEWKGALTCTSWTYFDADKNMNSFTGKFASFNRPIEDIQGLCAGDGSAKEWTTGKILSWNAIDLACPCTGEGATLKCGGAGRGGLGGGLRMTASNPVDYERVFAKIIQGTNASLVVSGLFKGGKQRSSGTNPWYYLQLGKEKFAFDCESEFCRRPELMCNFMEPDQSGFGDPVLAGEFCGAASSPFFTDDYPSLNATRPSQPCPNGTGIALEDLTVRIVIDPNPFKAQYDGAMYFLVFSVCLPLCYCYTMYLAIDDLRLRLKKKKKSSKANAMERVVNSTIMVMLYTEVATSFLMAVFFFSTGFFARVTPYWVLSFFIGELSGFGFATTILTALFWNQLTSASTGKRTKSASKLKKMVYTLFGCCIFLDVFTGVGIYLNLMNNIALLMTLLWSFCQICAAVYFIRQVKQSLFVITEVTKKATAGKAGTDDPAKWDVVKRVGKWLLVTSVCMVLFVVTLLTTGSGLLYTPVLWPWLWAILSFARWGTSFAQVMAVRSKKKGAGKKKKAVQPTAVSAGESVAVSGADLKSTAGGTAAGDSTASTAASTAGGGATTNVSSNISGTSQITSQSAASMAVSVA